MAEPRTLYPANTQMTYSQAKWSLADDHAQNQTKPVAGDTIICTVNSGKVICDEAWAAASLSATGASYWDFVALVASVSGDITLDDITATIAAANITAANLNLGTNGSLTMSADLTLTANVEIDGGTWDFGATTNVLTLDGDFIRTSGTINNGGTLNLVGSGTSNLANATWAVPVASLIVGSGVTAELANNFYTKKIVNNGVVGSAGNKYLAIYEGVAGWFVGNALEVVLKVYNTSNAPGSDVLTVNKDITFLSTGTDTITMDANIDAGSGGLTVAAGADGHVTTLTMNGYSLVAGNLVIGRELVSTASGVLNLGSATHTISGNINDGHDDNTQNALDLGRGILILGGTMEGNDNGTNRIVVTTSGGYIVGGTVNNTNADSEVMHYNPAATGTGNTNITEVDTPPGQRTLAGVGS